MIEPHWAVGSVMIVLGAIFVAASWRKADWLLRLTLFALIARRWGTAVARLAAVGIGIGLILSGVMVLARGPVELAHAAAFGS